MSYQDFLASIWHARLRDVAEHWDRARGGRLMPAWNDLDATVLRRNLAIVWAWKYDRATDRFTGRLAGEEINDAFGKSLRGTDMAEFFKDFDYPDIFARHKRVVTEPCCAHGTGQVFLHARRVGRGERIIMPLAEDGVTGDGIFGATLYDPRPREWEEGAGRIAGETVTFYPLP
ncbi:MAG TPA: PAS domain-containing protein [Alphaproteobacteria bacterium]|nr:PAS domain-containing protein [Alphaproteobacteria bacterium]